MDEIIIEKLEKENKELASITRRMIAYFIDNIICSFLIFIIFKYFQTPQLVEKLRIAINEQDIENFNLIIAPFITYFLLIKFSYLLLFFYMYGATLGNMITKTRIISYEHFDSPDFFASLNRAIMFMVCDIFLSGILFLSIFINKTRRHFADMISKSVVIRVD